MAATKIPDMSAASFEEGLAHAYAHLDRRELDGQFALILIDGRAGSGKTRFAKELAERFFSEHKFLPKMLSMDDIYPGWEGLQAGSVYLQERVLSPLADGRPASWQLWNWELGERGQNEPGNGIRSHEPGSPLIVEGCGSISRENSQLATLRIWIESDTETRRARFSERDEGRFDGFFGIWAAQEDAFYGENRPLELCDLIVRN